ncbi:1-acyl-sn-glycerol-3-phosphate acyltransferase epsilon [Mus caroli]|uniref:1-acyl-sn-glycerol-3-phosphate acyltransferase epsilon n=1 Tax=Mus caroli TaxID=10089 RepID=A0A6P5Q205_MUSCR|nr:1-acyl-sn-glycerol-3-phosphate acyltransferase epsilon [Mus caroli]
MLLSLVLHTYSMRYLLPSVLLLGSAPTYLLAWTLWRVLSALMPARLYQRVDDRLYCVYQNMVLFFFENYTGVQILLYGDLPKNKENVIYLANHQSTVDWIVADMLAARQDALGHVRYVLKDKLKWLPLYGFYFAQHGGIYVKRSAKFNDKEMRSKLQSYVNAGTPEEFLCKQCPKLHIHFDRIDRNEVPEEQEHMKKWLHERFEIKDRLLIEFYDSPDPERRNKFPGKSVHSRLSVKKTLPSVLILGSLTAVMLMTESGRKLYMGTWLYGTLLGCLWFVIKA